MSHTSPTVELTWAILSVIMFVFLLGHLYHFDKFRCLKFWQSEQNGAFKKVMTYAYLISVPLIGIRSCIFATIKYKEGYTALIGHGIIPKPYQLWPKSYQALIFPANLCFAIAWSFEMVAHLEELCFWLFLTRTTPLHLSWFKSWNFKVWVVGSIIAVAGMPITAVLTKNKGLQNEAYICLAGSIGSALITIAFLRVLWIFPSFIKRVKSEGAGKNVIIRLERFNQLNVIRVCFRSIFVFSLMTLGVDGVLPHNHVNESAFWTDLLALSAGIGCMVSSVLTLLIFFPRSMAREAGYGTSAEGTKSEFLDQKPSRSFFDTPQDRANPFATPDPSVVAYSPTRETKEGHLELGDVHYTYSNPSEMRLNFGPTVTATLPLPNLQKRRGSTVHPMIMHYRSPIDVVDYQRAREVYDRYRPGRI